MGLGKARGRRVHWTLYAFVWRNIRVAVGLWQRWLTCENWTPVASTCMNVYLRMTIYQAEHRGTHLPVV